MVFISIKYKINGCVMKSEKIDIVYYIFKINNHFML